MKKIKMPKYLHELFGYEQNLINIIIIMLFATGVTSALMIYSKNYWLSLKWYQSLIFWLLFFDISGGVVANLTKGTNNYYLDKPKLLWIFYIIHVQPLIISLVVNITFWIALVVWGYTIICSVIIHLLLEKNIRMS